MYLNEFILSSLIFTANLVLHRTVERIHVGKQYGDIPRGIFVIRGENVILLGEVVRLIQLLTSTAQIRCNSIPKTK